MSSSNSSSENSTLTTHCRGGENFSDRCIHNGPSARVWFDIFMVGWVIFGLFFCYVKWSSRRLQQLQWIEWNHDDESTSTESDCTGKSSRAGRGGGGKKKRENLYYHMHPEYKKKMLDTQKSTKQMPSNTSIDPIENSTSAYQPPEDVTTPSSSHQESAIPEEVSNCSSQSKGELETNSHCSSSNDEEKGCTPETETTHVEENEVH